VKGRWLRYLKVVIANDDHRRLQSLCAVLFTQNCCVNSGLIAHLSQWLPSAIKWKMKFGVQRYQLELAIVALVCCTMYGLRNPAGTCEEFFYLVRTRWQTLSGARAHQVIWRASDAHQIKKIKFRTGTSEAPYCASTSRSIFRGNFTPPKSLFL